MCQLLTLLNQSSGTRPPRPHSTPSECLATCEAAARFRFYALLRGLADIYDAVESPQVILINERKALKQCHVSCNMKSIMSRVAESTELASITLAQLVRNVRRVP
jgi:hypothetical protein